MPAKLLLPRFELLKKQPDPPHTAKTISACVIHSEQGAIDVTVRRSRKGDTWWISGSMAGLRMSNTLRTQSLDLAKTWCVAVQSGNVGIKDD